MAEHRGGSRSARDSRGKAVIPEERVAECEEVAHCILDTQ